MRSSTIETAIRARHRPGFDGDPAGVDRLLERGVVASFWSA